MVTQEVDDIISSPIVKEVEAMPELYKELDALQDKLEHHYHCLLYTS